MRQLFHYQPHPGYEKVVEPGQGEMKRLEMGLLRMPRDETYERTLQDQEAVLVILSGECDVDVDGQRWTLQRASVFAQPAMAVYIPRHRTFTVTGVKPADLVVYAAPAGQDYLPRLIERGQGPCEMQGAGNFQRRVCWLVDESFPASRLLVGETYAEAGHWASYPPHKHEEDNYPVEVRLEQASFFQIDPPQGFALQYLYNSDRSLNEVYVVRNNDAFATARGYHPLASAPGYTVYELWGMAGDGHVVRAAVDPDHAWIAQEAGLPEPVVMPG